MAKVADRTQGNIGNAAAIGVTIGLGLWAFAWFFPTIGAAVLYLLFGRSWTAARSVESAASPSVGAVKVIAIVIGLLLVILIVGRLATDRNAPPPPAPSLPTVGVPVLSRSNSVATSNETQESSFAVDLKVKESHWSKSDFGIVTWRFRVHNQSKTTTYKDLHFKTTYWAPSGTRVDESLFGHTEYVVIRPGKTASIKFDEFAHSQASSAAITIDSATKGE